MGGLFGKEGMDVLTGDQAKGEEVVEEEEEEAAAASEEAEVEEGEVGQAGSKLRYVVIQVVSGHPYIYNITCEKTSHSTFLAFWQIPHGKKYDKQWLLTALQNICSVPYRPVQVRFTVVLWFELKIKGTLYFSSY